MPELLAPAAPLPAASAGPAGADGVTTAPGPPAGNWPSDTTYDSAPKLDGNAETITVANPSGGQYYYLMVKARPSYAGVQIVARYQ